MKRIRVRRHGKKHIYIHNDLSQGAYHFKQQIERRIAENNLRGISYEYMACLIMSAFAFEAKINFLGYKPVQNWNEREGFHKKINKVFAALHMKPDWKVRPYSSIGIIKEFRDMLAHGKPDESEYDEVAVVNQEDTDKDVIMYGTWTAFCSKEQVFNTYDDIQFIWAELCDKAGLTLFDTLTHGSGGSTFIDEFKDEE